MMSSSFYSSSSVSSSAPMRMTTAFQQQLQPPPQQQQEMLSPLFQQMAIASNAPHASPPSSLHMGSQASWASSSFHRAQPAPFQHIPGPQPIYHGAPSFAGPGAAAGAPAPLPQYASGRQEPQLHAFEKNRESVASSSSSSFQGAHPPAHPPYQPSHGGGGGPPPPLAQPSRQQIPIHHQAAPPQTPSPPNATYGSGPALPPRDSNATYGSGPALPPRDSNATYGSGPALPPRDSNATYGSGPALPPRDSNQEEEEGIVSKQRRLSVRQMAAQLESARSSALSSSSSGGPSSSSRSHWPSAAAPSLPPLPREPPRPMRDHGPRQSSNVPDETLLPLAVGQAFAWKEWEGVSLLLSVSFTNSRLTCLFPQNVRTHTSGTRSLPSDCRYLGQVAAELARAMLARPGRGGRLNIVTR